MYQPGTIEKKWQKYWQENQTYRVTNGGDRPKFYVLDMFPYPSGAGLHVGHPLGYIATDILARFKRMQGYNVLHPMGYDSFGLPAEQYAIQTGIHPAVSTADNISRYRSQLENLGFNYDWSREVSTSNPDFYHWTQWIFLQLFSHYYDLLADKATPISELIGHFEVSGTAGIQAFAGERYEFTAAEWNRFTPKEQSDVLMNFRLAYRTVTYVNWCEALGTVLANDEVKDGVSERGGYPVEKKPMLQWSLRITAYAERLLNDIDQVDWSDALKAMQRNWIGRSEGAQLFFEVLNSDARIEIFTTRPDTIFGATFMVLAPEHDLVPELTSDAQAESVRNYQEYVASRSEVDRMAEVKKVTGAFTGSYALNPFTGDHIPIWIGEYVLKDYGTGAIMAVPSDDERDQAFAQTFNLPIIDVVDKTDYPGATLHDKVGKIINSGFINGMEVPDAIRAVNAEIERTGLGLRKINYKLRDAIFSRQRYWGEPFPIYYDGDDVPHALNVDELPLTLPELEDFKPGAGGKSPLARKTEWVDFAPGKVRETDTMPGYAGSSWYHLRYMDAHNNQALASPEAIQYWQDVDVYVGGTEHAVGHLMYSRFWHKFLFDKAITPTPEPFRKLINQGMIQGVIESIFLKKEKENGKSIFFSAELVDPDDDQFTKIPVHIDYVSDYGSPNSHLSATGVASFIDWRPEFSDALFVAKSGTWQKGQDVPTGLKIITLSEVGKMSKRYFNVVNPDDIVAQYGADCFRMYEMFLGPIQQAKPWDTKGIDGVYKFLRRFWSLFEDEQENWIVNQTTPSESAIKVLHQTIKKVREDVERFSFNTSVSAFMICVNELKKEECHSHQILEPLVRLIAPFAPHVAEELWHRLHDSIAGMTSVHLTDLPEYDEQYLTESEVVYPVCINGKKRGELGLGVNVPQQEVEAMVKDLEVVQKWTEGKPIRRIIVIPNKMINVVI